MLWSPIVFRDLFLLKNECAITEIEFFAVFDFMFDNGRLKTVL